MKYTIVYFFKYFIIYIMKIHIDYGKNIKIRSKIKNAFWFKTRRLDRFYDYIFIKLEKYCNIIWVTNGSEMSLAWYINYIYNKKTNTLIPKSLLKCN